MFIMLRMMVLSIQRVSKSTPHSQSRANSIHPISEGVHSSLMYLLKGEQIPKKKTTRDDFAAYRLKSKFICCIAAKVNLLTGKQEERILVQSKAGYTSILLKKCEVAPCIQEYYNKCKGAGARKIYKSICKSLTGISERDVQKYINANRKGHRMNPTFENKPPLIPVQSSQVFNHLQIDLVTMEGSPVTVGNRTYKYIMILLDIFSRYIFLRPLQSKKAAEMAFNLLQIFSDAGPPIRIQSDQGRGCKAAYARTKCANQHQSTLPSTVTRKRI